MSVCMYLTVSVTFFAVGFDRKGHTNLIQQPRSWPHSQEFYMTEKLFVLFHNVLNVFLNIFYIKIIIFLCLKFIFYINSLK